MGVDVLAVQEILTTPPAQQAMDTLRTSLNQVTGGQWQADLQSCGAPSTQHVGFLWNSSRVALTQVTDVWELNGAATETNPAACFSNLRPGRYAHAQGNGGVDLHLLSVHLDSGQRNRDYQHRRQAASRVSFITREGTPILDLDHDVIVLGDYNTMGREEPPPISATEELAVFDQELAPGFRRLPMTPGCTEYFEGKPGTLDHVVVSTGMQEAGTSARVTGYCAVAQCAALAGTPPAAALRLSDHCPVLMDIRDADVDD
jgi:endonuclease/exonuclease/phosphatase family metal-dependent hydrolase